MKRWCFKTLSSVWLLVSALGAMPAVAAEDSVKPVEADLSVESSWVAQREVILELGSTGSEVKDVQAMLSLMGYYDGIVDGNYEQMTVDAVRKFQTDVGLFADGVVGPQTWQRLLPTPTALTMPTTDESVSQEAVDGIGGESTPTDADEIAQSPSTLPLLKFEDTGETVSRLQQRLAELNLYGGPIDGVFGEQTEAAVEQFQRQSGLTVDGVVGPATWSELL